MEEPEMQVGWDGRQVFIFQMGKREDIVLDCDYNEPQKWYEAVRDYFDTVACAFSEDDEKDFDKDLDEINRLLFGAKDKKGDYKNDDDILKDKKLAYPKLRKIMRKMKRKLWNMGLYMPRYEKKDPSKAIMDMGD